MPMLVQARTSCYFNVVLTCFVFLSLILSTGKGLIQLRRNFVLAFSLDFYRRVDSHTNSVLTCTYIHFYICIHKCTRSGPTLYLLWKTMWSLIYNESWKEFFGSRMWNYLYLYLQSWLGYWSMYVALCVSMYYTPNPRKCNPPSLELLSTYLTDSYKHKLNRDGSGKGLIYRYSINFGVVLK
jgi:hypothetical protein